MGAEEPPPLPEKTAYADYGNTVDNDIISNRQIVARSVSHKDKVSSCRGLCGGGGDYN